MGFQVGMGSWGEMGSWGGGNGIPGGEGIPGGWEQVLLLWEAQVVPPTTLRVSAFGVPPLHVGLGPWLSGKGLCLLRLSSSSVCAAPGLTCLKEAMKADSVLTLSGKKRRTGNALLTSSSRKTQCFHMFLLLRVWTWEVERSFLVLATSFWFSLLLNF